MLIPSVLTLVLMKKLNKTQLAFSLAIELIAWTLILISALGLISFLFNLIGQRLDEVNRQRWFGDYWWSYWSMFIGASIIPLSLLIKKLRTKAFYLVFVIFCMNLGNIVERIVILMSLYVDGSLIGTQLTDLSFYSVLGVILSFGFLLIAEISTANRKRFF